MRSASTPSVFAEQKPNELKLEGGEAPTLAVACYRLDSGHIHAAWVQEVAAKIHQTSSRSRERKARGMYNGKPESGVCGGAVSAVRSLVPVYAKHIPRRLTPDAHRTGHGQSATEHSSARAAAPACHAPDRPI